VVKRLLKPVPSKFTDDAEWDWLLAKLGKALFSPRYQGTPKLVVPVRALDDILDRMAQRLMDTHPVAPDPVTEQRVGEISDAIRDARAFLNYSHPVVKVSVRV
jgi:hypothetical protein